MFINQDIRNTVGDIPMRWYDDYDHLGYNWDGKKILKPSKVDELDNFINKMEDPDYWYDKVIKMKYFKYKNY